MWGYWNVCPLQRLLFRWFVKVKWSHIIISFKNIWIIMEDLIILQTFSEFCSKSLCFSPTIAEFSISKLERFGFHSNNGPFSCSDHSSMLNSTLRILSVIASKVWFCWFRLAVWLWIIVEVQTSATSKLVTRSFLPSQLRRLAFFEFLNAVQQS